MIAGAPTKSLSEHDAEAIWEWGMRMKNRSTRPPCNIKDVKYEGHVVVLDDGTRWEVGNEDSCIADCWARGDSVVVVGERMFKLEESESVIVRKES